MKTDCFGRDFLNNQMVNSVDPIRYDTDPIQYGSYMKGGY
jgi:hypothetical protein